MIANESIFATLLALICWLIAAPLAAQSLPFAQSAPTVTFERTIERDDGGVSHTRVTMPGGPSKGWVALVPSLGRGVEDFTEDYGARLTKDLARAGYSVVLVQPRGVGQSTGDLTPSATTMDLLASDLEQVFDALNIETVSLVGHAFGNRLSRYFAATRTERVDALVLLAAGGDFELSLDQRRCLLGSFNLDSPEDQRIEAIRCAFFAEGQDPTVWLNGWYPRLALAQINAAQTVASEAFKTAGGIPFLLVQPEQDFIAPPDLAGRKLKQELGDQVTYVEIPDAGHALLPEKPQQLSETVVDYLHDALSQSVTETVE